jgi:aminopeptidase N
MVATQLEAISAREVFPSADDPHFKAIINLSVVYPKGATIFSNSFKKTNNEFR